MSTDDIKILVEDLRKEREILEKKDMELKGRAEDLKEKLSKVSKMTQDEAKKIQLEEVDKDIKEEVATRIRRAEERIKLDAKEKAKEILIDAMKHGARYLLGENYLRHWALKNGKSLVQTNKRKIVAKIVVGPPSLRFRSKPGAVPAPAGSVRDTMVPIFHLHEEYTLTRV